MPVKIIILLLCRNTPYLISYAFGIPFTDNTEIVAKVLSISFIWLNTQMILDDPQRDPTNTINIICETMLECFVVSCSNIRYTEQDYMLSPETKSLIKSLIKRVARPEVSIILDGTKQVVSVQDLGRKVIPRLLGFK